MKKFLLIFLCLVVILLAVSSCKKDLESEEDPVIDFSQPIEGDSSSESDENNQSSETGENNSSNRIAVGEDNEMGYGEIHLIH